MLTKKMVTRGDYKFRTITAGKVWYHCKNCLNSYVTTDPRATDSVFKPTMGSKHYSEFIGKFYLCPDCEHLAK